MSRKMIAQAGGLDIEDGTYRVKLVDLEDAEGEWQGNKNKLYKWHWELPDLPNDDGGVTETSDLTSRLLGPKSNLWARYEALMGLTLEVGAEIDIDDMIGKEAQASFAHKTSKGEPSTFSRIQDVIPLPKTGKPKAASPPDPFEGFLKADGSTDWPAFAARMEAEDVVPVDLAKYMGVEKATRATMEAWVREGKDTLIGLLINASTQKHQGVDPDELPFE